MLLKRVLPVLIAAWFALCGARAETVVAYDMPYYMDVDITNQIVTIYNTADDSICRQMLCSTGINDSTPTGEFYMTTRRNEYDRKEWYPFVSLGCYAKWVTRVYDGYMFHSIPFNRKSDSAMSSVAAKQYGTPASHGCIRLRVEDAEFIAKNCMPGTRVNFYKSNVLDEELRQLLYTATYTQEGGMSYREFLGETATDMGKGSIGDDVLDLQYRLSDLGYFDGEIDGKYNLSTVLAVKNLQKDMGVTQNGIMNDNLLKTLYSDDAPVSSGLITLEDGRGGPAVKKLQTTLAALKLYEGPIDGVYDLEVSEAVKVFQSACGYETDGVATAEVQKAVYYQYDLLLETFGEAADWQLETRSEDRVMGTVEAKVKIMVREKANTKSDVLAKLSNGDTVEVVDAGERWAKVVCGDVEGYMRHAYLNLYKIPSYILDYSAEGSSERVTIGHTRQEYAGGAKSFAEQFAAYSAKEQASAGDELPVECVTVNTGADEVKLNLRAEADPASEVLAEVPNGTQLRAVSHGQTYTLVGYDNKTGYLLNDYLSFWQGTPGAQVGALDLSDLGQDGESDTEFDETDLENVTSSIKAVVVKLDEEGQAKVYKKNSTRSDVIGALPLDAQVTVEKVKDGWALISYLAQKGFMQEDSLKYSLEDQ